MNFNASQTSLRLFPSPPGPAPLKIKNPAKRNESKPHFRYKTKGWSPARRAAQAERIRRTKPWARATGPRTPEGKASASRNAYKHGLRSTAYRRLYAMMALFAELRRIAVRHSRDRYLAARAGLPGPSPESLHLALCAIKRRAAEACWNDEYHG